MDKAVEKEIIKSLRDLVRIESVESGALKGMPFGRGVDGALHYFLDLAKSFGLKTKNYGGYAGEVTLPAADAERGKRKGAEDSIAVLVHLDVVPAGDGWAEPPFSGAVKGGRMYGRGTTDDKGAAVVCLYALKRLLEENAPLKKDVKLIAGCDEESGQLCMKHYKKHAVMPETGFSPDADFPVINCEKTILQLKLRICADKAFINLIDNIECGDRPNVVPDRAEARLKDGAVLKFKGKAAHSMIAGEGDNAAHKLVRALREKAGKGKSAALDFMTDYLCDTDGKALGIGAKDKKSGALTLNFASLKFTQGGGALCAVLLDLRCPLSVEVETVIEAINAHMPKGSKAEVLHHQPGLYVSPQSKLIKTLLASYEKATGRKGGCMISGGGTYARQLKNGVAFGPSEKNAVNNIHSADEFIEIKQLGVMYEIYYDAIKKLAE